VREFEAVREQVGRSISEVAAEIHALIRRIAGYDAALKRSVRAWAAGQSDETVYRLEQSDVGGMRAEAERALRGLRGEMAEAEGRAARLASLAPARLTLSQRVASLPAV